MVTVLFVSLSLSLFPWFGLLVTIPSLPWLVPHSSLQCCHSCFRDYRAIKVLRITENLQNHSIQERTNYRTTKERHERKKKNKIVIFKRVINNFILILHWLCSYSFSSSQLGLLALPSEFPHSVSNPYTTYCKTGV